MSQRHIQGAHLFPSPLARVLEEGKRGLPGASVRGSPSLPILSPLAGPGRGPWAGMLRDASGRRTSDCGNAPATVRGAWNVCWSARGVCAGRREPRSRKHASLARGRGTTGKGGSEVEVPCA